LPALKYSYRAVWLAPLSLWLSACASSLSPEAQGFVAAFGGLFDNSSTLSVAAANTKPNLSYLRVGTQGKPAALMVLGYAEPATPGLGPVEVWYSASGEVIRLQQGRIAGTTGLETDWANVVFSPFLTDRRRDVLPDYGYGINEHLQIHPVEDLSNLPAEFSSWFPPGALGQYRWFTETARPSDANSHTLPTTALPDSWFAVIQRQGKTSVEFSRQCLSHTFCLTLQRWPMHKAVP
jgi:Group 4 capsule polysaccharide lipoprotein gfcB, YjbF